MKLDVFCSQLLSIFSQMIHIVHHHQLLITIYQYQDQQPRTHDRENGYSCRSRIKINKNLDDSSNKQIKFQAQYKFLVIISSSTHNSNLCGQAYFQQYINMKSTTKTQILLILAMIAFTTLQHRRHPHRSQHQSYDYVMQAVYTFDTDFAQFVADREKYMIVDQISTHLNIDRHRIRVKSIEEGSVIFTFIIFAETSEELTGFKSILSSGTYDYPVLEFSSEEPKEVSEYDWDHQDGHHEHKYFDYLMEGLYKFDVDLDEFESNDGETAVMTQIATLLAIDPKRIFVIFVDETEGEGSTNFNFVVFGETAQQLTGFKETLSSATFDYTVLQFSAEEPQELQDWDDDCDEYDYFMQATYRFDVALTQFKAEQGKKKIIHQLAVHLDIRPRRIHVISLTEGSTIFNFFILADTAEELTEFSNTLKSATYDYTVLQFSAEEPEMIQEEEEDEEEDGEEDDEEDQENDEEDENGEQNEQEDEGGNNQALEDHLSETDEAEDEAEDGAEDVAEDINEQQDINRNDNNIGMIVGISVGSVVLIALIIVGIVCCRKHKSKTRFETPQSAGSLASQTPDGFKIENNEKFQQGQIPTLY